MGKCDREPPRRANNASHDARRRRAQGCEIEKRQYKLAPCAPALFIGPSARSASRDARPPARTTSQSKQQLDGYARGDLSSNPPTWPLQSARRFQAIQSNNQ
jgi:hypothetical protein